MAINWMTKKYLVRKLNEITKSRFNRKTIVDVIVFDLNPKTRKKVMPTKKKIEKVEKVDEKHSVPMVEREEATLPKRSTLVDRFRGKVKPSTKEVKADSRPVIDMDDETKQKFVDFAAARELAHMFDEAEKELTSELYSSVFDRYKAALWKSKSQPVNPSIKVNKPDGSLEAEGQFMVQTGAKIKIKMPEVPEGELPEDVMLSALISLGVKKENAARLIEKEVSFVPQWSLNFTDMLHGIISEGRFNPATETQISASETLFQVVQGQNEDGEPLSSKERIDLLKGITEEGWILIKHNIENHTKYYPQLVEGKLFLDRVCTYADTFEELESILTMFDPIHYCSRVKFACSDSKEEKDNRLFAEAKATITGTSNDSEIEAAYKK